MARETIPSECFSGAWKWEKGNRVFDCLWLLNIRSIQMYSSTDLILQLFVLYVKTLPIFKRISLITWWVQFELNLQLGI